jgi:hypothetical protein
LPNVTLMVLLVSLGGALALFALIGHSFLFAGPAPPIWPHVPARDDIYRVPSDPDTSGPSLASAVKPADVRPDGVDGRHPDERDAQVAADALPREIGETQIDADLSRGQRRASSYQRLANPFAGLGYPDDSESRWTGCDLHVDGTGFDRSSARQTIKPPRAAFIFALVPELTRAAGIKLTRRVSLRRIVAALWLFHRPIILEVIHEQQEKQGHRVHTKRTRGSKGFSARW